MASSYRSYVTEGFKQVATADKLDTLLKLKDKIKFVIDGRQLLLIKDKGHYFCLDEYCYHAGGPLSLGDIEDFNGSRCITCPWHHNRISLDSGEHLYTGIDPFTKQTKSERRQYKQRTHDVIVNSEGVFVKLSTSCTTQKYESDHYYEEETQKIIKLELEDDFIGFMTEFLFVKEHSLFAE